MNTCSTGLASSLQANWRAKPCGTLYATDVPPIAARGWGRKAFVRLEWHEPEPPSEMCDSRGAAAPLAEELNVPELESLISLLKCLASCGMHVKKSMWSHASCWIRCRRAGLAHAGWAFDIALDGLCTHLGTASMKSSNCELTLFTAHARALRARAAARSATRNRAESGTACPRAPMNAMARSSHE